jgi:hypothetical protein
MLDFVYGQAHPESRSCSASSSASKKRMEALQRVKLAGYEFVISELDVGLDYLRRAARYLAE